MTPSLPLVRRIILHSYYGGLASIVVLITVLAVLILPSVAHAADRDGWAAGLVPACGGTPTEAKGEGGSTVRTYTPCSTCDLAQLIKNLLDFVWKYVALTGVALMLMIGGFQMVTGALSGSPASHQKGLSTIKNAFIGLAIVFFAWLAIDTVIKFIAQQSLTSGTPARLPQTQGIATEDFSSITTIQLGPWNALKCTKLEPVKVTTTPPKPSTTPAPTPSPSTPPPVGGSGVRCDSTNNACSPQALQEYGYTFPQANAMSCIAMTESGGLSNFINPTSGACGTFQILRSNWNNPRFHQGNCSTATDCRDVGCNAQTAFLMSQNRISRFMSPYSDWTCPNCNPRAQACVDRYDPGF